MGDVVEFAEMVYVKDPALKQDKLDDRWLGPLAWLGKTDTSDGHTCVNAEGDELGFYRSIRRLPEDKRWDKEALKRISVTPWMPKNKSGKEPTVRRKYITWHMVRAYGGSPGCRNCSGEGGAHSDECRKRFEKIW